MLQKVEGPECPGCGCQQSELVGTSTRKLLQGQQVISRETVERRQCAFCDRRFYVTTAERPANVVFVAAVRCPHCQSTDTKVTSTRGNERFHRCHTCQQPFKSIER